MSDKPRCVNHCPICIFMCHGGYYFDMYYCKNHEGHGEGLVRVIGEHNSAWIDKQEWPNQMTEGGIVAEYYRNALVEAVKQGYVDKMTAEKALNGIQV